MMIDRRDALDALPHRLLQTPETFRMGAGAFATRLRNPRSKIGRGARISPSVRIRNHPGGRFTLGERAEIRRGVYIATYTGRVTIGDDCFIGAYAALYGHGGLTIGDEVLIAPQAVIVPANHTFADPSVPIRLQGETRRGVVIEDDVWIATRAIVLDGVTVGRGAVVAAGAVVTRDVPPYAVVAGTPARVVGERGASPVEQLF